MLRRPRTTLRAVHGARVAIESPIWITSRATGATLSGVHLTSRSRRFAIPLKVQADRARVRRNVIRGSRNTICVLVASRRRARGVLIEGNRIERCGRSGKFDHLIYLARSREAVVRGNFLLANPGGWGVHLYPDADWTLVEHNVIHGNLGGVVFAGDGRGQTSDWNEVRNNSITGSGPRWNLEASWSGGVPGIGNTAHHNCLRQRGPSGPAGIGAQVGFTAAENSVLDRLPYVNAVLGDFRLRRETPCARLVGPLAGRLVSSIR
jgi:nitrous oxidase accessory protein NosD